MRLIDHNHASWLFDHQANIHCRTEFFGSSVTDDKVLLYLTTDTIEVNLNALDVGIVERYIKTPSTRSRVSPSQPVAKVWNKPTRKVDSY